ncbi:MAG: glycine dehydrogenase, partial [Halobacteria archaeon]|nr:glycine dehydrogenase [Halobacteria archaeon]
MSKGLERPSEEGSEDGSPYAPHDDDTVEEMLGEIGVGGVDDLFDIPEGVGFDAGFGIPAKREREVRESVRETLSENEDVTEFLGRGHYSHYVPSVVDHLADRSEFLTSYTQYQPEVTQGFLQALFEYQSLVSELTGLEVANSSMYDAATALGEAALFSARVREGDRVLVPDLLTDAKESVLRNYVEGAGLEVEEFPTDDANVDVGALEG